MGALIHRGKHGFWASNGERDAFLDWFAEARCATGDPRRARCLDEGQRFSGCGLDLDELLRSDEALVVSPAELAEVGRDRPYLVRVLNMVALVTSGRWPHDKGSEEAVWWRVPWLPGPSFTEPGVWSEDCLDLTLDFERPDDARLVEAATALWSHEHMQGCWLAADQQPTTESRVGPPFFSDSERAKCGPPEFEGPPPLYGFARVHGLYVVPCATYLGLGEDYMFLSLSFRAPALRRWMPPEVEPEGACGPKMFAWLAEVGRHVHEAVRTRCAVIGWEPTLPEETALRRREFESSYGYLLPSPGALEFVPPHRFSAP